MDKENYEQLSRQLIAYGYDDPALLEDLWTQMYQGKSEIELTPPEGTMSMLDDKLYYVLYFFRHGAWYYWNETRLAVYRNLPIAHGCIGGIDTAALEQRMKPINWLVNYQSGDAQRVLSPVTYEQTVGQVRDCLADIESLLKSGSEHGVEVAIALLQRYVLPGPNGGAQGLHTMVTQFSPPLKYHFDMLFQPFTMREGYNLLCGRAVRKKFFDIDHGMSVQWYRLDLDSRSRGDMYRMEHYPDFDLLSQFSGLACPELAGSGRFSSLKLLRQGDLLHVTAPGGHVRLSVDPAIQTLYGVDGHHERMGWLTLLNYFLPPTPSVDPRPRQETRHQPGRVRRFFTQDIWRRPFRKKR